MNGVVFRGNLIKLRPGRSAGFSGEGGTFKVEHDSIEKLCFGVHEAEIDAAQVTMKKGDVLVALGSPPVIGKCLFAAGEAAAREYEQELARQAEADALRERPEYQAARKDWIERYTKAMLDGGSRKSESDLREKAEDIFDADTKDGRFERMEGPEFIAEEYLEYEKDE